MPVISTGRSAAAGKTRICPACQHHLRFDPKAVAERRAQATFSALRVEGAFRHPAEGEAWEYSIVISVRNDRGDEVSRQVVGVGALGANEGRTVTVSVDVFKPPEK